MRLSLTNWGQWRRKYTSSPQLHNGFIVSWNLCLNLCSLKWFNPSLSLVIRKIPLGLWQLWKEIEDARMNLKILVLRTEKLSDFLRRRSTLFHSIIEDEKKELLKKLWFVFRRGMLCIFRVEYTERLPGIKLKRYLGCWFSKTS